MIQAKHLASVRFSIKWIFQKNKKKCEREERKKKVEFIEIYRNFCLNLYFILIFPFSYWGKVLFLGNFSNHISQGVCILCVCLFCSGCAMVFFSLCFLFFFIARHFLLVSVSIIYAIFLLLAYALIWMYVYIQKIFLFIEENTQNFSLFKGFSFQFM